MFSPNHIIFNLGLLSKKNKGHLNPAIFLGAIAPDLAMIFLFAWEIIIMRTPFTIITSEKYFSQSWQLAINISHAIPLILLGLAISYWLKSIKATLFFISMALHSLVDFFLHCEDAHQHLWPLTTYKFCSPISYWDPSRNGTYFQIFEVLIILLISYTLFPKLNTKWSKLALIGLNTYSIIILIARYIIW